MERKQIPYRPRKQRHSYTCGQKRSGAQDRAQRTQRNRRLRAQRTTNKNQQISDYRRQQNPPIGPQQNARANGESANWPDSSSRLLRDPGSCGIAAIESQPTDSKIQCERGKKEFKVLGESCRSIVRAKRTNRSRYKRRLGWPSW